MIPEFVVHAGDTIDQPGVLVPRQLCHLLVNKADLPDVQLRHHIRYPILALLIAALIAEAKAGMSATGQDRAAGDQPARSSTAGLTTSDAAAALGVTDRTIRRAAASGQLPATRVGRRSWLISPDDLEQYRAARAA